MAARKKTATRGRRRASRRRARSKATSGPSSVFLINMIPKSLSNESWQDSEPHLAVNPADPLQIVGTAFTPDPAGGARGPGFISRDGGAGREAQFILPSAAGGLGPPGHTPRTPR